jgi:hypothetical protein
MTMEPQDAVLTVAEIATSLRLETDTIRRLFTDEPGVVIICFGAPRKRVYRTLRIPRGVVLRVLTRLTAQFEWRVEDLYQPVFTIDDIAHRLKVSPSTVRRLLARLPGALVIRFPTPGKRTYCTLRIPQRALDATLARLIPRPDSDLATLLTAETIGFSGCLPLPRATHDESVVKSGNQVGDTLIIKTRPAPDTTRK